MTDAKGNAFEEAVVELIFLGTSFAGLFENDQSTPSTYLSVQLHTGSPGETGDCTSSEATYGAYARVGVGRTATGWTITTPNTVKPTTNITFPQCTSGTNTITHFSIGLSTVAASTSVVLYYGAVTPNISVSAGVTPRLTTATAITEN
jgi:hypothetical protein